MALPPLRCATAGSVDDGKSTLIGRLLYDAKALHTDQLAHLSELSQRRGLAQRDLALVTDGLRAEREQGITIDVAWRYFATATRRFILADSPGHLQYTRNMVTATSHADVAIILVDARRGITEQTRRHLFIARLLGSRGITVAVNKMDQVSYSLDVFAKIRDDIASHLTAIRLPRAAPELAFIPLSALHGDNVVNPSMAMPWYDGPTLLAHLERAPVDHDRAGADPTARMFVQCVLRGRWGGGGELPDFRGVAGRVASGVFRAGDVVRVLPSDLSATVGTVSDADGPLEEARAGMSVTLSFTTDIDVGRGDLLVAGSEAEVPIVRELSADLAWMHKNPAAVDTSYLLKIGTREVKASLVSVDAAYDVTTGGEIVLEGRSLGLNDLGRVKVRTSERIAVGPYATDRTTGSFLLVDPTSGDTLAAGMVR